MTKKYIGYYCELYDKGFHRVGCIGCPMQGRKVRLMQFEKYPNHKKAYINSMQKALIKRPHPKFGTDANLLFEWWLSDLGIDRFFQKKQQITLKDIANSLPKDKK